MHSDGSGQKSLNCLYSGQGDKPTAGSPASHASYSNVYMAGQEVRHSCLAVACALLYSCSIRVCTSRALPRKSQDVRLTDGCW